MQGVFNLVSKNFTALLRVKILALLLLSMPLFWPSTGHTGSAQTTDDPNQQLSTVQQAITKQQAKIDAAKQQRTRLRLKLKTNDLAIAKIAKQLLQTQHQLNDTKQKIAALTEQQRQLTQQKNTQQEVLAKQLRTAYSNGQNDYIKLLLNQTNPAKVQRTLTYYHYLTDAKIAELEQFNATLAELTGVTDSLVRQQQSLTLLTTEQQQQQTALNQSKQQRTKTLAALSQQLSTDQQKLAQLKTEEENLVSALKKLSQAAQIEIDLTGLANLKHKLNWPTQGRLTNRFGKIKQGYLRWKGILISAPVGKEVKAIHNGKVLFADWLNGYGLVTVIDHGNGYMSLYGHNQTILKSVGERVETGEPIALVGQSGGQSDAGVYFEIRYQGKAMNPRLWCK
jgi:murein hydrolase activator